MKRAEIRLELLKVASAKLPYLGQRLIDEVKILEQYVTEPEQSRVRQAVEKHKKDTEKVNFLG
jgi:hypothetical protein